MAKGERLLLVEWDDHKSPYRDSWETPRTVVQGNQPLRCVSVGWLIAENDEVLTLCASRSASDMFSNQSTILKNCIRKRRILRHK